MRFISLVVLLLACSACRDAPRDPQLPAEPITPEADTATSDTMGTGAPTSDEINAGAGILRDALRGASGG